MRRQRDELLDAPPFPVYGLSAPALRPYALADFRRDDRDWHWVRLCYGNRAALAGPFVSVTTFSPRDHLHRRYADEVLHAALATERARAAEDSGVEQPDTSDPLVCSEVRMRLDSQPEQAQLLVCGDLWAARISVAHLDVLSVGRGVRPGGVRLVGVDELAPYWHGREEIYGLPFLNSDQ